MTFTQKYFPRFHNSFFYRILNPFWRYIKFDFLLGKDKFLKERSVVFRNMGIGEPALGFFSRNQDRVKKVASLLYDKESKNTYLKMVRFRQTFKFWDFPKCNEGNYFRNSFFEYGNNEVLIDCGAFTGDTIEEFLSMKIEYKKIVAFEPEPENFKILKNNYYENPKIILVNKGVYSKDGELYFSGKELGGSTYETSKGVEGEISIKVCSIDCLNLYDKVTFIKMDIEGGEIDTLIGAKETILRDKPKLAISIYHSNEDMVRIAELVHEIVPEYKFYVKQNMGYPYPYDTVLYAQVNKKTQNI